MNDYFSELEIVSDDGKHMLVWEDIGEGDSGDYNPDDPLDKRRLRFSVYVLDGESSSELDDASYCTLMTPDTTEEKLRVFAARILEAVSSVSYNRELQRLTWTNEYDLESQDDRHAR